MNLITIENLSKSYGEKILLDNISLGINEGEKIGVIGINGTGKSTLLKIISGIENYDSGNITKANKIIIEHLRQKINFDDNVTILQQIFKGNSPIMKVLREYEDVISKIEKNPEDMSLQNKLMELSNKMDAVDAWQIESNAKTILTKLGINNFNEKVGNLSGGQRKRIALAESLIRPCDLLILDEPTNHLDNETIKWLEEYLNSRKGALIMITHDRYFLDRVTNRIIELYRGKLYSYEGNYSVYLTSKVERKELEKSLEEKRQNLLRRELAWIKRGVKARGTKQKARVDRFQDLVEQEGYVEDENVEISVASTRLGKKVIEVDNISKKFEDKKIIENFSLILSKDDRIGIIGKNGAGKSTLLNILCGKLKSDRGDIAVGETVKMGYFSQEYKEMDPNMRVIDYIKEGAEYIETKDGVSISASQMLEKFLFPGELQWSPISKLSGGEKRRLYLLRVLMDAPNVLFLDEPTNDLDIETLNILENYIEAFNGAVITVSHDRYFLDKISNKILAFQGNGQILEHTGNYSEYIEFIQKTNKQFNNDNKANISKTSKDKSEENENEKVDKQKNKNRTLKFSYKEKLEYEKIDGVIEEVENELAEVEKKLGTGGSNYGLLEELLEKKDELETKLEELMERWTYLNELAEKINNSTLADEK
ncbi:ABC-F family ATP-binding cassette domain-containing protein [Haloimpatiens sp. FM7330]|uniref:ABC-F family ATP-binding cassette domain-containing protein n=1 Tax=Haloimpatiens sp. FM7330 TaxID=3298610 RepID=UPI003644C6D1